MKGQAIKPNFLINQLPSLQPVKDEEEGGPTDEETKLYSLAKSGGWKILEEYFDNLTEELNQDSEKGMEAGLSFEELGKNTVVVTMTRSIIKKVLDRVQDAVDACENGK